MSLAQLPTELYAAIIQQFDQVDHKPSLLALSRAIPISPVPVHTLFEDIRLKSSWQVTGLYLRLRKHPEDIAYVRTFVLESWTVDADILVNLVALLPNIRELTLFVGPNFAPEHLEDLFKKPRSHLKYLSLRFRPYVQRATYVQFMKGAYFDSMLSALALWPRIQLPVVSIIQDPLIQSPDSQEKFAQPLVFFHLDPLSTFATSLVANTVLHLRVRVPGRPVARHIVKDSNALPNIELLDLATSDVNSSHIQDILCTLIGLKHLILDGCPVVSQRIDALDAAGAEDFSHWAVLGRMLATTGLKIAREREQHLQHWLEITAITEELQSLHITPNASPASTTKKRRSKVAMSPFKLRTSSLPARSSAPPSQSLVSSFSRQSGKTGVEKIRILPPVPALRSLALTAPMITSGGPNMEDRCAAARAAFELGWAEGLSMLAKKRLLIRTSWTNGIRVMRVVKPDRKPDDETGEDEEGFAGLEDVRNVEEFNIQDERCPLLCLAGPGREGHHLDRCPHMLGWDAFKDEL